MRQSEAQNKTRPRLPLRAGATPSVRLSAVQMCVGSLPPEVHMPSAAVALKDFAALHRFAACTLRTPLTAILAADPLPLREAGLLLGSQPEPQNVRNSRNCSRRNSVMHYAIQIRFTRGDKSCPSLKHRRNNPKMNPCNSASLGNSSTICNAILNF